MFKRISKEIRNEILTKITEGKFTVAQLAEQYAISPKTIYSWLNSKVENTNTSLIGVNKLKRENEELKKIIGIVTLQLEREKKGKVGPLGR